MKRLALLVSLLLCRAAHATGQCDEVPTEQYRDHPEDLRAFAAGRLGLVRPTFARMYLAVAYLGMTGRKLDATEQRALVELFQRRNFRPPLLPAENAWAVARKALHGKPLGDGDTGYEDFLSTCRADAFVTAARTAARLQAALPPAELAAWRDAQDVVFSNCSSKTAAIPAALPKAASSLARAERDYQIAAATMYAGKPADAAVLFGKIAKDAASPWASWGTYLEARALVRDAAIATAPNDYAPTRYSDEGLARARRLLETLAGPKGIPERARAARALLGFIRVRLAPAQHIQLCAGILRRGDEGYVDALADWVVALDIALDQLSAADVPMTFGADDLAALRGKDELTDWVLTIGALPAGDAPDSDAPPANAPGFPHALERWRKTGSTAWLLAALATAPPRHAATRELAAAAAKVPRDAPAFDSVTYYDLRLQLAAARPDRAALAQRLEAEIGARRGQPRSSVRNALLDLRLGLSVSLDEALGWSLHHTLGASDDCGLPSDVTGPPREAYAHAQVALPLERAIERGLPLGELDALLANAHVPALLRARLVRMAWSRALVLGASDPQAQALADRLLPALAEPALAPLAAAKTPDEKRLQAALALLDARNHAIDPGALDGSLSCPGASEEKAPPPPPLAAAMERLVPPHDLAARRRELAALRAGGSSFDVGVAWLVAYATAHPDDARLPQLLYDLNGQSRRLWGACHASRSSKAAYNAMHKLFPSHPLTKKVKYWF